MQTNRDFSAVLFCIDKTENFPFCSLSFSDLYSSGCVVHILFFIYRNESDEGGDDPEKKKFQNQLSG